jgi:hypothetical protein
MEQQHRDVAQGLRMGLHDGVLGLDAKPDAKSDSTQSGLAKPEKATAEPAKPEPAKPEPANEMPAAKATTAAAAPPPRPPVPERPFEFGAGVLTDRRLDEVIASHIADAAA